MYFMETQKVVGNILLLYLSSNSIIIIIIIIIIITNYFNSQAQSLELWRMSCTAAGPRGRQLQRAYSLLWFL
ncbi:hypothetical protein H671_1g0837 [Cricetulus griseus]|nr:hypothetical protein H671_1g0837 [Cricetulus griseus]